MKPDYPKPEILSPAGDYERLLGAVDYGADAVYLGATSFGMRNGPANFDFDELKKACEFAHDKSVKIYLTCNTVPRNGEIDVLPVDGTVRMKVPAGTQSGTPFKLSGHGVPFRADGDRGPHIVTIIVETPTNLSRKQRELLEEFRKAKKRGIFG